MKVVTDNDFKIKVAQYIGLSEDIVVTRKGKMVATLAPIRHLATRKALSEMREVLREAEVSEQEVLNLLRDAQAEVYRH